MFLSVCLSLFFRIVFLESSKTDLKCLLLGKDFHLEKPTQEPENRSLELAMQAMPALDPHAKPSASLLATVTRSGQGESNSQCQ